MIQLSPSAEADVRRLAAVEIADRVLRGVDLDSLQMIDLATAASFLGITLSRAAKVLPVVDLGPRTRRVTVAAYKAYLSANTRQPQAPSLQ